MPADEVLPAVGSGGRKYWHAGENNNGCGIVLSQTAVMNGNPSSLSLCSKDRGLRTHNKHLVQKDDPERPRRRPRRSEFVRREDEFVALGLG